MLTLVYSESTKQIAVPPGGTVQTSADPDRFVLVSGPYVARVSDKLLLRSGSGPVTIPETASEGDFVLLRDIDDSWAKTPPTVRTENTSHTIGKDQFTPADQSLVLDPGDRDWQNQNQEVLLVFDGTDNWRVVVQGTSVEQVRPAELINDVQLTYRRETDRTPSASTFMWFHDYYAEERGKLSARLDELESFQTSLTDPVVGALVHNAESIVSNDIRLAAIEGLTYGQTYRGKRLDISNVVVEVGGRYAAALTDYPGVSESKVTLPQTTGLNVLEGEGSTVIMNVLSEPLEVLPDPSDTSFDGGSLDAGNKAIIPARTGVEFVVAGALGSDRNWQVKTVFNYG